MSSDPRPLVVDATSSSAHACSAARSTSSCAWRIAAAAVELCPRCRGELVRNLRRPPRWRAVRVVDTTVPGDERLGPGMSRDPRPLVDVTPTLGMGIVDVTPTLVMVPSTVAIYGMGIVR